MSKHDVVALGDRPTGATEFSGPVHDLSVPGGRPLCGADEVNDPSPRRAAPVSCPACTRLLGEDVRRQAHAARPHAEESED